jgi:hypothetical protein
MPHTQVNEIEFKDDSSLVFIIDVFGFEPGAKLEISGSATQANGAIATFYDIQDLPPANPDGGSRLTVQAAPTTGFEADQVITVAGRATKIWGTVLYADTGNLPPGVNAVWTPTGSPDVLS